jgi:transcriptional regulator with XRE-family HTH domain
MRERERKLARKRLDVEMRPYRRAGREKNPTHGLLRAVRQALRIPVAEIAAKMGVSRSVIFDLEAREPKNTINLSSMSRMARAMGCKVVYGIVPEGGKTLEELAEERLWVAVLGVGRREWMAGSREQGRLAGWPGSLH